MQSLAKCIRNKKVEDNIIRSVTGVLAQCMADAVDSTHFCEQTALLTGQKCT